jgi:hypothetical protein
MLIPEKNVRFLGETIGRFSASKEMHNQIFVADYLIFIKFVYNKTSISIND